MPGSSPVVSANLGPKVAAFACAINGKPAAVVNIRAAHDPTLRVQATCVLLGAGLDVGLIIGALYGIRR